MLRLGVIEPSSSEWSSLVVIILKKDGSLQICIDFRKLNSISEFEAYPMPRIDDLLERIGTDKCENAFNTLKAQLCAAPVLRSPDFSKRFLVQVDASAVGLGAVLAQEDQGGERPILYLSRKMQPRETRYSIV